MQKPNKGLGELKRLLDNYRSLAIILALFLPIFAQAQLPALYQKINSKYTWAGGQFQGYFQLDSLLNVGRLQLRSGGDRDTSFTIAHNTASITLDTIAADRTVTFPTIPLGEKGVLITLYNSNASAFTWNVSGPVIDASNGVTVSTIARGLHLFYWIGTRWVRFTTSTSSSGGSTNIFFDTPIDLITGTPGNPDTARLCYGCLPVDTTVVAIIGDTAYNLAYYGPRRDVAGYRDSTVAIGPASATKTGLITTKAQTLKGRKDFGVIGFDTAYSNGITSVFNYYGTNGIGLYTEGNNGNRPTLIIGGERYLRVNETDSTKLEFGYHDGASQVWRTLAYRSDITGGGGSGSGRNFYNMDSSLSSNRTVNMNGKSLLFQQITGNGPTISSGAIGLGITTTGTDAIFYGTNERAATNTAVETFSLKRTTSGTPAAGIGQYWSFKLPNDAGTVFDAAKIKTTLTNVTPGSETSKTVITGILNGTETDWFSLIPSYGLLGTDTIATRAYARSIGGGGSGTVTNVATGYGLSGGPITSTGTILADTTNQLASKLRLYKVADSLGAIKQATLVSGTNIKTINGISVLGSGNLTASSYKATYFDIYANGADTTGATDISTIVSGAFAAGYRMIYMRKGTYLISSTIQIPDSAVIVGDGPTNTRLKLATNITAFKAGFALGGDGAQFRDFSLEGTRGSGGNSSQKGIVLDSVKQVVVDNCSFYFLGDYAIIIKNNGLLSGNGYTYGNKIRNCYGETNGGGIQLDVRGEYNSVVGTTFAGGSYGIRIAGGNNVITGSNFSANAYNVYLETGANDGHGTFSGNTMNHAGTSNIYATGLVNGFDFTGCMVYSGNITIISSAGVIFNGGHISVATITVTSSPTTAFNNVYFPTLPTWTVSGGAPLITKMGNASTGINIYDGVNNKNFFIGHLNTVVNFGDATSTRFNFNGGSIVTKSGGNYDANRGLSTGAMRGDYSGSPVIADPFQFYNSSTTGSRFAVLGNNSYALRVENGNQVGIRIPTATAMLHIAGSGSAANLGQLRLNKHHVVTTNVTGNGTTVTVTFAAQPVAPFAVGSTIVVAGVSPSGYNGSWVVTACTTTTVSYTHTESGTQTVQGTVGSMLATPVDGEVVYNPLGDRLHFTNSTAVRGTVQVNNVMTSAAGTLTLALTYSDYVFTGTTTTWTLPAVAGSANVVYYIKNRGSGSITLNTNAAANEIYDASAVNTLTITAGSSLMLRSDGTYFNKF